MTLKSVVERRRLVLIALMWVGALIGSWAVYEARKTPSPTATRPARPTDTRSTGTLPPSTANHTPTHFRLNPQHTARSEHVGPALGSVRWKRNLDARITAQPVISPDGNIHVGTHAGVLWTLNSEGIVIWKRDLGARIFAAALAGPGGELYVGTDGQGFFGLDARGNPRFQIDNGALSGADADTAPTLAPDGSIRFAAGNTLYSIDSDGHLLWTFRANDKIFTSPTLDHHGNAYVGAQDEHVYAVDAAGKLLFRFRTGGDIDASPVIDRDGTIYVGSDDQHVYAITSSGTRRWATKLDGYVRGALALGAEGSLLATHWGQNSALVALDRASGVIRFRFAFALTDRPDTGVRGGALVDANGAIYVGSDDDYLYALTPDGKLRWAFAMGSDAEASTTLAADGTLYAASAKGVLYAIGGNE